MILKRFLTISIVIFACSIQSASATQSPPVVRVGNPAIEQWSAHLASPQNGLFLLIVAFLGYSYWAEGGNGRVNPKNRLATSVWANSKERSAARKIAHQQLNDRQRDAVPVFIGHPSIEYDPDSVSQPGVATPTEDNLLIARVRQDAQTIWIPDAQRGIAVVGGSGTGKTRSVIDPIALSVFEQGHPMILYDFKYPVQSRRLITKATEMGYQVDVFAPGFKESATCNPLDFIDGLDDVDGSLEVATVFNRNFKPGNNTVEDPFFTNSGDQLIQAILMLAKSTPFPDIILCAKALGTPQLINRLMAADLPTWVKISFGQLMSMAASEKTVASVVSTAALLFTRLMSPTSLGVFCGKSTIPLRLEGKQLLIIGLNQKRRNALSPVLATVLNMLIVANIDESRKDPLFVLLDELPTIYIPDLVKWINEFREYGLSCILGFQNLAQLEKAYGRENSRLIFGACATKFVFNPQELESAEMFSKMLGEEHLQYKHRSRSQGKSGSSISVAPQERTRKLFATEQIMKLKKGHAILINPEYANREEGSIPTKCIFKKPFVSAEQTQNNQKQWNILKEAMLNKSNQIEITDAEIARREQYFLEYYPIEKVESSDAAQTVDPEVKTLAAWSMAANLL